MMVLCSSKIWWFCLLQKISGTSSTPFKTGSAPCDIGITPFSLIHRITGWKRGFTTVSRRITNWIWICANTARLWSQHMCVSGGQPHNNKVQFSVQFSINNTIHSSLLSSMYYSFVIKNTSWNGDFRLFGF